MKLNIFCNVTQRRAEATSTGTLLTWPNFTAGDRVKIGIRFLEQIEGSRNERSLGLKSGKLTLGLIDAQPTSGQLSLKVGSGASSAANTTPLVPHNVSPTALAATINVLSTVSGGPLSPCVVTLSGGTYEIAFADGTTPGLTVVQNTLTPTSFARIRTREENGAGLYEMRLMQAPLAQAPLFTREVPPAPTIETVQDGGADEALTYLIPEIQRLTIPALFRGSFVLRYGEFAKSPILGPEADDTTLADALKTLFAPQGYVPTVRAEEQGSFLIVFEDEESIGLDMAPLTVEVFTAPEGDVTFDLDLNTREVFDALRAASPRKDCYLEFEAEVCDDGQNPADSETIGRTVTLFQSLVTLQRELNWSGLAAAANVDWLRPPTNRSYVPFTLDHILTGQQQAFVAPAIGDGEATEFTLDHNFPDGVCQVVVVENATGRILRDNEYAVHLVAGSLTVGGFATVPTTAQYTISATAIGPESVFQAHTHTIAQITGLQAILDTLGGRVEALEDMVAVSGAGATAEKGWSSSIILPPLADVFPAMAKKAGKLVLPPLPRARIAVTPFAVAPIDADELPEAASATGAVYLWHEGRSEVYMPGDSYRRGRLVKQAEAAAFMSDGFYWWLAEGIASGSYYPTEMNRVLWEIAVSPEQLAPGRRLKVNWSFLLALVAERPELRGTYMLRVRKGRPATEGGGDPNIEGITWDSAEDAEQLLFEQKLTLTRAAVIHEFAAEIVRAANGDLSASKTIYGKTTTAAAPQQTNFILRAELSRFDLTNYTEPTGLPVGQVYLACGKPEGDAADPINKRFKLDAGGDAPMVLSATIS